jgi:hypothetical protein
MPNNIDLTIEKWSAWAPGVENQQEWQQWANGERTILDDGTPDVKFVVPMLRRRLSLLSRMALYVANECLEPQQSIATIFCSRHGELHRTIALLQSIVIQEPLSPMGFSLSVPNTASGLYSISRQDTSVSTTLSAGADSFEQALIDATTIIKSGEERQVLLICCDMPLPEVFAKFANPGERQYAFALLLSNSKQGEKFNLAFNASNNRSLTAEAHPLSFLRYLLRQERQLVIHSSRLAWSYTRHVG